MAANPKDKLYFFGKSHTGLVAREVDWSNHHLGPAENWSSELKVLLASMFSNTIAQSIFWKDGKVSFYNDLFIPILGKTRHPVSMGAKYDEVWADAWPVVGELLEKVLDGGDAVYYDDLLVPILGDDGQLRDAYFTFSYSPIFLDGGECGGLLITCIETTKKVEAEKKVLGQNIEISDILENMNEAFFTVEKDWTLSRVNNQFETVIKNKREDVVGKDFIDLYFKTPEQKESLYVKTYTKVMETGIPDAFIDYYAPFDIWTSVNVYPKYGGGIAVFFREISDEKRAAIKLQNAILARDNFLGVASHELNTPLTTLKLQSQTHLRVLARQGLSAFSDEKLKKIIEGYLYQTERLSRLVSDMLDVSRIETGKLSITKDSIDLTNLVKDVVNEYCSEYIKESKIKMDLKEHVFVKVDSMRLEQVLINLLTNAKRYAPKSPIEVFLTSDDIKWTLTIKDFGPGIALDSQEKIFERYERMSDPSEVSGLGLGLYISKQIIEAHNGTIELISAPGKGCEFKISAPI